MNIEPENYFSRVWHTDCPKSRCGVMRRLDETLTIEDGSVLPLWECLHCGEKTFAGLDAKRRVTVRPAGQGESSTQPAAAGGGDGET